MWRWLYIFQSLGHFLQSFKIMKLNRKHELVCFYTLDDLLRIIKRSFVKCPANYYFGVENTIAHNSKNNVQEPLAVQQLGNLVVFYSFFRTNTLISNKISKCINMEVKYFRRYLLLTNIFSWAAENREKLKATGRELDIPEYISCS